VDEDEYGAMTEWYLQGKTEVVGEKHYTAHGAMVEWYWHGKTEVLREKHLTYLLHGAESFLRS
jgi:hypothetical protein